MRARSLMLAVALVGCGALVYAFNGEGGGGGANQPPPPVNTASAGILLRVGLSAETLAAAGITSVETPALVAAVEGHYSAQALDALDTAYVTAKQTHDRLRRTVQSGLGSEGDVTALRSAETALAAADTARKTHLASLRNFGLAAVSQAKATLVQRIEENRKWSLPAQYLVKERSEADWVALRDALSAKRISQNYQGETLAPSAQTLLAQVDAESEIAAAKVSLDTNLVATQTAWNTAASD